MQTSDVSQGGILMYTALSGNSPFPWTGDDYEYMSRLQNGVMKSLGEHPPI
jgi:eukaryotic-like serine/threonine-protein kinase